MSLSGQIFLFKDFKFDDGTKGPKLFIALCDPDHEKPCLALITTSQIKKWYEGSRPGCNPKKRVFYIPKDWREFFRRNTYVLLPQIYPFPSTLLLKEKFSGKIDWDIGKLSNQCLSQLINCLKKYFKDDIPIGYHKYLFAKIKIININSIPSYIQISRWYKWP